MIHHTYLHPSAIFICNTAFLITIAALLGPYLGNRPLWAAEPGVNLLATESPSAESHHTAASLRPPIRVGSSGTAGDGGTIFVELVGANDRRLTLSVSQDIWETGEGDAPHNTLFLHVPYPSSEDDQRQGRLPVSDDEVDEVLRLLRLAIDSHGPNQSSSAKSALERLERQAGHAIHDPSKGKVPEWYAAYEAKMRQSEANLELSAAREARFLNCFPPVAAVLLERSLSEPLSKEEIRARAQKLVELVADPMELLVAIYQAFGVKGDDKWEFLDESYLVLFEALQTVDSEHVVSSLSRIENDDEAMLGACRVLFDPGINYADQLDETEWRQWVPRLTKVVLSAGNVSNARLVVDALSQNERSSGTLLLRSIAGGDIRREQNSVPLDDQEASLRETAYLALALRNDQSVKKVVRNRLQTAMHVPDRAALEVCLALLGEPLYLKASHFELRSRRIGVAALRAIEMYSGRHGMDILIYSALDPASVVQKEAVVAAQRLSGQQWLPDDSTRRSRSYSTDAAAWWNANRDSFMQQFTSEGK